MNLTLNRTTRTGNSTIGELYVNGAFECFTLEDIEREEKVHGKTAIPRGRYEVVISFSNRFKKYLPLLLNVPGFAGVRIHPGNCPADTEGCILVGRTRGTDFIGESRKAFAPLFAKMKVAEKKEKIYLEIR